MAMQVDREGTFQGQIVEYALQEGKEGSQAVAIFVRARLDSMWNVDGWEDWSQYDVEAHGYLYVIKKDGTPNQNQVTSLVKAAGWDSSLMSIVNKTWQPTPCSFTIERSEYKGKVEFKISFVNEHDREPGGAGNVTPDRARELEARFGAPLRALGGAAKRNATTPAKAAPPAPPQRQAQPAATPSVLDVPSDIPF